MNPRLALLFATVIGLAACDDKKALPPTPTPSVAAAAGAPAPSPAASVSAAAAAPAPSVAPDTIAAQHVLVAYKGAKGAPKGVTRSKADAKKRAEEVAAKAKSGDDFSALVASYSDDEGTKDRQGNLGKFNRASKVKPFADTAFALAVGETSAPVETEFGFHVIKRNQ